MLESFPVAVIVGTILGFLSGLGIGGGSLLIIWLTVVLGTDPAAARFLNLLFYIPSALTACFLRCKNRSLDIPRLIPAIIAGCISAAISAQIYNNMNMDILKKLFGILLIAAGIRELFNRGKEKGSSE